MKEECNCYRKGETKRVCDPECDCYCHSPNQESTSSWSERFDNRFYESDQQNIIYSNRYKNIATSTEIKDFISKELELERQKAKEETLAMVLKEIEEMSTGLTFNSHAELIKRTGFLESLDTLKEKLQVKQ